MERDTLVVSDGDRTELCTVSETVETSTTVYAHVEGDTIDGWAEVPENPAEPKHALVCEDCGHLEENPEGEMELVEYKNNTCEHRSNAELLQQIHETKTGHDTRIERRAA